MAAIAKITWEMHDDYSTIFSRNGWFKDTFFLNIQEGAKPYLNPSRYMAYAMAHNYTTSSGQDIRVVQKLCFST